MDKLELNRIACRQYYQKNREQILAHKRNSHINHSVWKCMRQRCSNSKRADYKYYGGAGIAVCESWQNSFAAFNADMGDRPSRQHTLDRIDGTKGYYKENCRWATRLEQAQNLKTTRKILYQGTHYSLSALARLLGISTATLHKKLIGKNEYTQL